jgi:hypothetical protein
VFLLWFSIAHTRREGEVCLAFYDICHGFFGRRYVCATTAACTPGGKIITIRKTPRSRRRFSRLTQ